MIVVQRFAGGRLDGGGWRTSSSIGFVVFGVLMWIRSAVPCQRIGYERRKVSHMSPYPFHMFRGVDGGTTEQSESYSATATRADLVQPHAAACLIPCSCFRRSLRGIGESELLFSTKREPLRHSFANPLSKDDDGILPKSPTTTQQPCHVPFSSLPLMRIPRR